MRWLTETGKYSYGIYVYHIPIYALCDHAIDAYFGIALPMPLRFALPYVALLMGISFLVAKVSYDYFESRILALKVHFRPRYETPVRLKPSAVGSEPE